MNRRLAAIIDERALPALLDRLASPPFDELLLKRVSALVVGVPAFAILQVGVASGAVHVLTDAHFYKVPITSKCASRREPENWREITADPRLDGLFHIGTQLPRRGLMVLRFKRLVPFADSVDHLRGARRLLLALSGIGKRQSVVPCELKEVSAGLNVASAILGVRAASSLRTRVEKALAHAIRIGPAHGDFHIDNIMQRRDGAAVMIDADCFRMRGIQALDAVYLAVQRRVRQTGEPWSLAARAIDADGWRQDAALLAEFVDIDRDALLTLSALDRIGQEEAIIPRVQLDWHVKTLWSA